MSASSVSILSKNRRNIRTYDWNGKLLSTTEVPAGMSPMFFDQDNRLVCNYNPRTDQNLPDDVKLFVEPGYTHSIFADRVNFSQGTVTLNSAYTWSFGYSSQSCLIAVNTSSRRIFSLYPGRFGYPYKLAVATNSGRWLEEDVKIYSEIQGISPYNVGFWIDNSEIAAICKSRDPRQNTVAKEFKVSSPNQPAGNSAYLVVINPECGSVKYHARLRFSDDSQDFDASPSSGKMTLSGDRKFLYILFDKQLFRFRTDELKSAR